MRISHIAAASLLLYVASPVTAQVFSAGSSGMVVNGGTILSAGGLTLTPSADLTLVGNTLNQSATSYTAAGGGSINQVYYFSTPITYSGDISIRYAAGDLNGNAESNLQIAYGTAVEYTTTTGSNTGTPGSYTVSIAGLPNVSFSHLTATNSGVSLPLQLLSFSGEIRGEGKVLSWATASESGVSHFEVERSEDAVRFSSIGRTEARNQSQGSYSFTDRQATATAYYRLKMVDVDGSSSYSAVVKLSQEARAAAFSVHPNPATERVSVRYAGGAATITLSDLAGRQLRSLQAENGVAELSLQGLPAGVYMLRCEGAGLSEVVRFVKQ